MKNGERGRVKILIFALLVIFFGKLIAQTVPVVPSNYNDFNAGTIENPLQITDLSNLLWLSVTQEVWGEPDSCFYFEQTQDIDANETQNWNDGEGFSPIGLRYPSPENDTIWVEIPFFGHYNGDDHSIDNLYINRQSELESSHGLFGYTENAFILNLNVINANISSSNLAGILLGYGKNTSVTLCKSSGNIYGTNFVGCLIGLLRSSSLSKSSSEATVMGTSNCGGLIGVFYESTMENCYYIGHLATNEFSNGPLVGNCSGNSSISFCYVACTVENNNCGGLVGSIMDDASISNCFWDTETTSIFIPVNFYYNWTGTINDTYGLSTEELHDQTIYIENGWDFEEIWSINPNINWGYPHLIESEVGVANNNIEVIKDIYTFNFPNPFNPTTTIYYSISTNTNVDVTIFNIKGQKLRTLVSEFKNKGAYSIIWNGKDESNDDVASGVFIYRISTEGNSVINKLLLLK